MGVRSMSGMLRRNVGFESPGSIKGGAEVEIYGTLILIDPSWVRIAFMVLVGYIVPLWIYLLCGRFTGGLMAEVIAVGVSVLVCGLLRFPLYLPPAVLGTVLLYHACSRLVRTLIERLSAPVPGEH